MFFEKNLKAMTDKMLFIKNRIMESDYCSGDVECGTEEIAGRKILFAVKDGILTQLDTLYNQELILDKWFEKLELKYNSKVFMFGLGNGMFVRTLLERSDKEVTVYLYEPSFDILIKSFHEFDFSDILSSDRFYLYIPEKDTATKRLYTDLTNVLTYSDVTGYVNFVYPNYNTIFKEEYLEYHKSLQELFDTLQANRLVYEKFGKTYFVNSFVNFPYFCFGKNMNTLWPYLPKQLPAIIVSSGPSLSKNIEEIKRAKGKAIIIAADSAVSVLLNHNIIPDLFVCIDAKKSGGHFNNPKIKEIPMICMISTAQVALKEHKAPCYFVNDGNPHILSFIEQNNIEYPALACGGSVANTATSFAEVMGLSPIILVGQDLAYTDNKTHAEGSLRASWDVDFRDETFRLIEGQNGDMIGSSVQFKVYRDWFEREIIDNPTLKLVNATEGGALIHGAEHTTLKDAIDRYCQKEYDIESIFANSGYLFDTDMRQKIKDYMFGTAEELTNIKAEIRQCISLYEKMENMVYEGKYHSQKFITYYRKSEEINQSLMGNQAVYYPECLMQKEIGEHLRTAYDTEDDERKELLSAISNGKNYISLIGSKIDEILPQMCEYIDQSKEYCSVIQKDLGSNLNFEDSRIQLIWDRILNHVTPNMTYESLSEVREELKKLNQMSESDEYEKLIYKLYSAADAMRTDMVFYKLLVYSFLVNTKLINKEEIIEKMKMLCRDNEIASLNQMYYMYYYLKELSGKYDDVLFNRIASEYRKLVEIPKMSASEKSDNKSVICILASDDENENTELIHKCEEFVDDGEELVVIFSNERYSMAGLIPLYDNSDSDMENKILTEVTCNGKTYECHFAKHVMPSKNGYIDLLQYLSKYDIGHIIAPEDSILGKILMGV